MWPKLNALERLEALRDPAFSVLPFVVFGAEEWRADEAAVLERVLSAGLGPVLAVRSCAALEDMVAREPPGFFESVLDVAPNGEDLRKAVARVCASYARRIVPVEPAHRVIVQRQLLRPNLSGVCRVGRAGDYVEVDYDETMGRTDAVTAGVRAHRVALGPCAEALPPVWRAIRRCADRIAEHFEPPFFIEFAITEGRAPTVFQIRPDRRPLRPPPGSPPPPERLVRLADQVAESGPLSVMADWNPAEMLGLDAQPLDISLYEALITSGAWADGRSSVGWRLLGDRQLMTVVEGRPYVRLTLSLGSLLPAGLPDLLAERLVADRLALLAERTDLHDKVEFRLMWSACPLNEERWANELYQRGFSAMECGRLLGALRGVTQRALAEGPGLLAADLKASGQLARHRRKLARQEALANPAAAGHRIEAAISGCRRHGTIAFARQARLAFTFRHIVTQLVEDGAIAPEAITAWEAGLNTPARRLSRDIGAVATGALNELRFHQCYGHLRPNSYNIESLRYDERPLPTGDQQAIPACSFGRHPPASKPLAAYLVRLGVNMGETDFWTVAAEAYRGREELKFLFTALLSDILQMIVDTGREAGLERRILRQLPVVRLLALMKAADNWTGFARAVRNDVASRDAPLSGLRLPDLILEPLDLHLLPEPLNCPTFIGYDMAEGPVRLINGGSTSGPGLTNAIVMIETADPGYDWLFAHRLAGLVTAYGGEFSHMGVRCAEFGIPAVLGCGRAAFARIAAARSVRIDAAAGAVWADGEPVLP